MAITQEHTLLAQTAMAITHPVRQVIIRYLCDNGAKKFTEIHALFTFCVATVHQHLKVLVEAGMLAEKGDPINKKVRYYYVTDECLSMFKEFEAFMDNLKI